MIMLKKLRYVGAIAMLAVTVLTLAAVFSSCGGAKLQKLAVEGYREDFFVGDEFETGVDFKAYAVYSNGERVDVTDSVTVTKEVGMDMDVAGDYMITVNYEGKKTVYTVYVYEHDSTLCELRVDASGGRLSYMLGEQLSLDGIRVIAVYENEEGRKTEIAYSANKFDCKVYDGSDGLVEGAFSKSGKHKVVITRDGVSATFEITVAADLTSVSGAIKALKDGSKLLNGGKIDVTDTLIEGSNTTKFEFKFGNNYTYIKEVLSGAGDFDYSKESHYGIGEDGTLSAVIFNDGEQIPSGTVVSDMMNGVPVLLWWNHVTEYGLEATLDHLYGVASRDPNKDYKESIDASERSYSFSFGYLQNRTEEEGVVGDDYFFVNEVSFTLYENNSLKSVSISQILYTEGFTTDGNGHTSPNADAVQAHKLEIEAQCYTGERTAENPYSGDADKIKSFDLVYDGETLADGDVISGKVGEDIYIRIRNIKPDTANFESDLMYLSDGIGNADAVMFVGTGFTAYRSEDVIRVRLASGGEWDLIIKVGKLVKKLRFDVTGADPSELNTWIYSDIFGEFSPNTDVTVAVGANVYFRAEPNKYANGDYSVSLVSGGSNGTTLEKTAKDGYACWSFSTERTGEYVIRMISKVAPSVTCELKITVMDVPNIAELLKGSYEVTDDIGGSYLLTFTNDGNSDVTTGEVSISYTDAGGTASAVYSFTVSTGDLTLALELKSGENVGVDLSIALNGSIELEDRYGSTYTLIKK